MRMTYRCKSCGSNATAALTCDYCGAGTGAGTVSRKAHQATDETLMPGLLLIVGTMTAITALLLIGGAL